MDRNKKQLEIEEDYVNLVKSGAIGGAMEACTGFGKTTVSMNIVNRLSTNESVHVIVPTINLKGQWEGVIEKRNYLHDIKVFVVNTYLNLPEQERNCSFLILDEAHRYSNQDAELFSTVLDKSSFKWCLPLSATFTPEQLAFLETKGIKVFAKVPITTAVAYGWVSRFNQYNLGLNLTQDEKERYTKASNIMKAHAPFLEGLDKFKDAANKSKVLKYCVDNGYTYSDISMRLARFNGAVGTRKAIIYNAAAKLEVIPRIVDSIDKKTIVFAETIVFVEKVQKLMPEISVLYHGSLANKVKEKALAAIKTDEIKAICAPKALDEGVDIPALKCGIIASGTSTERQHIQRIGRVTRFVQNEIATVVNLYMKDTIEETWLKTRQKNMTNIRWIAQVDEIS